MTSLSVNINKLATLRNARGTNTPDLCKFTQFIISSGAKGITVHPRPDERHIKYTDVYELSKLINTHNETHSNYIEFNIEGYPNKKFLNLIIEIKPDQCTLVPDPPEALTSNSGWNIPENLTQLLDVKAKLKDLKTRVSIFVDPLSFKSKDFTSLEGLSPHRVEIYTQPYADSFSTDENKKVISSYKSFSQKMNILGIGINAGHDLNTENLKFLITEIPEIKEVSIGHALICDALIDGLETTLQKYEACLN